MLKWTHIEIVKAFLGRHETISRKGQCYKSGFIWQAILSIFFKPNVNCSISPFFSTVCIGIAAVTKGGNNRGDLFSTFCESPHCQPAMLQDLFYILSPFLASEQLILFKQLVLLKFIFTFVLKFFLYILTPSRSLISKCHFLVWNQICLLGHCLVSWGCQGAPTGCVCSHF